MVRRGTAFDPAQEALRRPPRGPFGGLLRPDFGGRGSGKGNLGVAGALADQPPEAGLLVHFPPMDNHERERYGLAHEDPVYVRPRTREAPIWINVLVTGLVVLFLAAAGLFEIALGVLLGMLMNIWAVRSQQADIEALYALREAGTVQERC